MTTERRLLRLADWYHLVVQIQDRSLGECEFFVFTHKSSQLTGRHRLLMVVLVLFAAVQ